MGAQGRKHAFLASFWTVKALFLKCRQWRKALSASIGSYGEPPAGGSPHLLLPVSDGWGQGSRARAPFTCEHVDQEQRVTWLSSSGSKTQCVHSSFMFHLKTSTKPTSQQHQKKKKKSIANIYSLYKREFSRFAIWFNFF